MTEVAAPQWRAFLRALADEMDTSADAKERDDLLRRVGSRMARLMPLPETRTLDALAVEVNDALDSIGWGAAVLHLDEADRVLTIVHTGLPRIGALSGPAGPWLSALLEGLYETWFAQQPGSQPMLSARRVAGRPAGEVVLCYARQ